MAAKGEGNQSINPANNQMDSVEKNKEKTPEGVKSNLEAHNLMQQLSPAGQQIAEMNWQDCKDLADKFMDSAKANKIESEKKTHEESGSIASLVYGYSHGFVDNSAGMQESLKQECSKINEGNKQDPDHAKKVYEDLQKNHPQEAAALHLQGHSDGSVTIEPGAFHHGNFVDGPVKGKQSDKTGDKTNDGKAAEQKQIDDLADKYGKDLSPEKNLSREQKEKMLRAALKAVLDGDAEGLKKIPDMPKDVLGAMKGALKSLGFRVGESDTGPMFGGTSDHEIIIVPPGSKEGIRIDSSVTSPTAFTPGHGETTLSAVTVSDTDKPVHPGFMGKSEGPEATGAAKIPLADELHKISEAASNASQAGDLRVRTPEFVMQEAMAFIQAEKHGGRFNENESKLAGDLIKTVIEHGNLDAEKIKEEAHNLGMSDQRLRVIVEQCLHGMHDVFGLDHMGAETGKLNKLSGELGGVMEK